jgi:pyruvate dehydrogenase E2 component (dihydrolipoamide acetyltransferase)
VTDQTAESAGVTTPLKGIRRTAARKMIEAHEAPVFQLGVEVDMTEALTVKQVAPGATVTDHVIRASAIALTRHPSINAWYGDLAVTTFDRVNIGIAVATEAGLTVPVVQDVGADGVAAIAAKRRDVVERARSGKLAMPDVTGGTFTISNLGMLGIDRFTAILNVPQVAILAVGSTRQRFVWSGDGGEWRPIAEFTLTCDHRAVDGATGAAFLAELRSLVEAAPAVD